LEPEIKKARQDLLFYPSVAMNKRVANSGECFFLGQPGGMADRKEKSRELEQSFVLEFFSTAHTQPGSNVLCTFALIK
jgi:hypothetical protein